jgi:hypothetical protein
MDGRSGFFEALRSWRARRDHLGGLVAAAPPSGPFNEPLAPGAHNCDICGNQTRTIPSRFVAQTSENKPKSRCSFAYFATPWGFALSKRHSFLVGQKLFLLLENPRLF